ncbi:MAG: DUF2007 domain-containing protein [Planctomycetaceae bacterium]
MQTAQLKTIASFALPHEAEIARASLEANGIPTYVLNAESATTMSHVGAGLEGVKLQVAAEDAERATAELAAIDGAPETPAWRCGSCGSDVDAGFAVCWSCDNSYSPEQVVLSTDAETPPVDEAAESSSGINSVHEATLTDVGDEETRRA